MLQKQERQACQKLRLEETKTWAPRNLAHVIEPHKQPFAECLVGHLRHHHLFFQPREQVKT